MTSQVAAAQQTNATLASPIIQTSAAMLFGAAVLFAVGFLPTEAAHNAAHDARHAMAFPCH